MTHTFTLEFSPNTIIGADFIAELPRSRKIIFGGRFTMKQTFIDSGAINLLAGETIGDRLEHPVLGAEF